MMRVRTFYLAGLPLALAAVMACHTYGHADCHPGHGADGEMAPPELDQVLVKGEYQLTDVKTGTKVDQTSHNGRWRLVFFGFTKCHTVCPVGLALMGSLVDRLDRSGLDVVPIFITVDPQRDTPAAMKEYLEHFDERIVGLSGSEADIGKAMKSFRIEAPRIAGVSETEYQLDHPALIMLMDPVEKYVEHIPSSGILDTLATALIGAIEETDLPVPGHH